MESVARGGTRWKRFAVVMVPSVAATAAVGIAVAQGALAASFSISGQQAKVSVDRLDGDGFVQYGSVNTKHNGEKVAVAVSAFKDADLRGLCQSVVVPVPIFGDVSLKLTAGTGGKVVEAKNLYIDLDQLDAARGERRAQRGDLEIVLERVAAPRSGAGQRARAGEEADFHPRVRPVRAPARSPRSDRPDPRCRSRCARGCR